MTKKRVYEMAHRESRIGAMAKRVAEGLKIGPSLHCNVCGRPLDDRDSMIRGIGPECWQHVLDRWAEPKKTDQ